ncbi:efflux RND transporter periplasmic adaptor subunit [Roseovarius sp. SCSIO 43702]|uniref:efflux RND transporter periplasmic adaptor subunit n=1 Tax=Roseovarius sp. SCSIO 43702 TaxID=2823043 RepID=UPI001C73C999|nr:efflux RND transporter periplasmic adaptor subunit [Roseovarius sp. SCSIO 43702]QYX57134.1 efflux RND transporter periplasmic adaptor subunit [Roseovarius sp. SCSIO 43702]
MRAFRQVVLSMVVLAAGLYVWIAHVPAAQPVLDRLGLLDLLGIEASQPDEANGENGRSDPAVRVITATVGEQAMQDRVSAIGDGRARRSVDVRSKAVGTITGVALEPGSYVEEGTEIVQLEDEAERIALEQAQIQLENARADAERARQLAARGTVSEVQLRELELALRSAQLAVRQAEFDLSRRHVEAPISGWVGIIDIEPGDRVNAQDFLVNITDRSEILVDFRVPERLIGKIAVGQPIEVRPVGGPETVLTGEVSAIDAVVDRASRTLLVQGRVPNDGDLLRAGMAFSVGMSFPGETLLSVPPLAVQWSGEGPYVWAVRDGRAAQVPVTIMRRESESVLVTSAELSAGETVVTEGVQTLREGAEVSAADGREARCRAGGRATL